jgi:hypothetical protein
MRAMERRRASARGLLCNRAAELEGPILLTTACDESNDGAQHRHDCDLLGHGITPDLQLTLSTIIKLPRASQTHI